MAYITHENAPAPSGMGGRVAAIFAAIGRALTSSAAMDARLRRVETLNAKTDAELAAMNLRRGDIPAHVFRDLMHI